MKKGRKELEGEMKEIVIGEGRREEEEECREGRSEVGKG